MIIKHWDVYAAHRVSSNLFSLTPPFLFFFCFSYKKEEMFTNGFIIQLFSSFFFSSRLIFFVFLFFPRVWRSITKEWGEYSLPPPLSLSSSLKSRGLIREFKCFREKEIKFGYSFSFGRKEISFFLYTSS